MDDLKPCPFCGSSNLNLIADQVVCQNCHAINGDPYEADYPCVEEWNTRPIEDALRAEVEKWQNHANDEHALYLAASAKLAVAMEALGEIIEGKDRTAEEYWKDINRIAYNAISEIAKLGGGK